MHAKLAGHLPLQEMIEMVIDGARSKTASVKKAVEDKKPIEKTASASTPVINHSNPDEVEKLAAALEEAAEKIAGDQIFIGGESHQGGEVLPTATAVAGKQTNKKDSSKAHNVPMSTGLEAKKDNPGSKTGVPDNAGKAPGGAPMPKKGVFKTASETVTERILKARKDREVAVEPEETKSEAPLDVLLAKISEASQGGMTLDSKSGSGPKPPSDAKGGNNVRSALESNQAAIDLKKVTAKGPQKKMLSEVLSEPAHSKAHDSKVHENLRNASKGGVKIAAATALLKKIASDPNNPKYALLKEAVWKKKAEKEETQKSAGAAAGTTNPTAPTA